MTLQCYECGNKVTVKGNNKNPKCNKCGSTDVDIPETPYWNETFQCYMFTSKPDIIWLSNKRLI